MFIFFYNILNYFVYSYDSLSGLYIVLLLFTFTEYMMLKHIRENNHLFAMLGTISIPKFQTQILIFFGGWMIVPIASSVLGFYRFISEFSTKICVLHFVNILYTLELVVLD